MKNKLLVVALLGFPGLLNFHFTAYAQPVATTLAASGVTATNATVNGAVNPNGGGTTVFFQYGLTTNYGSIGGFTALPATNVTLVLPGLLVSGLPGAVGVNWTNHGNLGYVGDWFVIASSADGIRLAAGQTLGYLWISTNSGVTWTQTSAPNGNWNSIASSPDGMKLAAALDYGGIYTSTDGGTTWIKTAAPDGRWQIASAVGGNLLFAASFQGGIWTSPDGGVAWTQTSAPVGGAPNYNLWTCLTVSADGTRLAAGQNNFGGIWNSTNSGLISRPPPTACGWRRQ